MSAAHQSPSPVPHQTLNPMELYSSLSKLQSQRLDTSAINAVRPFSRITAQKVKDQIREAIKHNVERFAVLEASRGGNALASLSPSFDPRRAWNHGPALMSEANWDSAVAKGQALVKKSKADAIRPETTSSPSTASSIPTPPAPLVPPGIMTYDEVRNWARLPPEEKARRMTVS